MQLSNLKTVPGGKKRLKRVGRGPGSGMGQTATAGIKGQKSRPGNHLPYRGFEGGQMPLQRRVPKRGFVSLFRKEYAIVNLDRLQEAFQDGEKVDLKIVLEKGIVRKELDGLKILAGGDFSRKLNLVVTKISKAAREKVEKAGGTVTVLLKEARKTKKFRTMKPERVTAVMKKRVAARAPRQSVSN